MPPGGVASALDMRNPKDRAALRVAIADWPRRFQAISPEKRHNWVADLEDVRASALNIVNAEGTPLDAKLRAIAEVRSCIATSAAIDSMDQKQEMAVAAARLKDLHHVETLEQADRHHAAGSKVNTTTDIRIIMADARGNERQLSGLREYYAATCIDTTAPNALPAPGPVPAEPGPPKGGNGRKKKRKDGNGSS